MCNLCSQAAIRQLARAMREVASNVPLMPSVYPDQTAPVVRTAPDGIRELIMMRWGFPPPMRAESALVTNVRNTASHWWKPWLTPVKHVGDWWCSRWHWCSFDFSGD
jgi:putative SOS response-associated peptidase YedK